MKNYLCFQKTGLWLSLSFTLSLSFAQNMPGVVKKTKTDKTYANTTEIHKAEKATDEQVLSQIEGDYGLGDVVRISNGPPPPAFLPPSPSPALIVSTKPKTLPIILTTLKRAHPSPVVVASKEERESSEKHTTEKPISTKGKEKKMKGKANPSEKTPDAKFVSTKEKSDKTDENPNISEKTRKEARVSSSNNTGMGKPKIYPTALDKNKQANSTSHTANKKWMADNLAAFNANTRTPSTRTHRSASTHFDRKKSGFLFFGKKKKTASMPKQSKNNKKDRCYQF